MILTISSQDADLCDSIAVALANRRADAGRNVLLLCQKTQSDTTTFAGDRGLKYDGILVTNSNWLAIEMKAGAKPRDLADHQLADELVSSDSHCRDIVIDMPRLDNAYALAILALSGFALYVIQVATLDQSRRPNVVEQIKVLRECQPSLSILIVVDEQYTSDGQALTALLKSQIPQLQFITLSRIGELTITELYRIIYLESNLTQVA
jgi:hypothetical protein